MALSRKAFLQLTTTLLGLLAARCTSPTGSGEGGEDASRGDGEGAAAGRTSQGGAGGGGGNGGGNGGSGGAEPEPPACASVGADIQGNHGHVLTVPVEDLESAVEKQYDIRGSADHTHHVTLTLEHFALLRAGRSVTVTSSIVCCSPANKHTVVLHCMA